LPAVFVFWQKRRRPPLGRRQTHMRLLFEFGYAFVDACAAGDYS
jgi:hypothetical protein